MAEASILIKHHTVDGHRFTIMKVEKKNLEALRDHPNKDGFGYLVSCPDYNGRLNQELESDLVMNAINAFDSTLTEFHGMIPYEVLRDDSGVIGVFFERWHLQ